MTFSQQVYIMALALSLGVAQPCRATVIAMAGNLAATLAALLAWDMGLLTASGSIITIMVIDLTCAAYLAFSAPIVAGAFAIMVPIYAVGLIAELPRATTFGIVSVLAYGQIAAILGGYGGGGGLRDHMRRLNPRRGDLSGNLGGVAISRGSEE